MSNYKTDKCLITGLHAEDCDVALVCGWSYYIKTVNNKKRLIIIDKDFEQFKEGEFFKSNKHIFAGAIINDQLNEIDSPNVDISLNYLIKKLPQLIYPKTPKEKMDNLLRTLVSKQSYDGENVDISNLKKETSFYYGHYFKSEEECDFYITTLHKKGFINNKAELVGSEIILKYSLTHEGLEYFIDISENGNLSKNCFVAMSFGSETKGIREAIRTAIKETGFEPIFIDERHIDSQQTINDAIIAELKRSKFCIADFTEQKNGVYFESGFALGQGKPVIYCCLNKWFNETHFDTKHFAHILYDTPEELRIRLINKIEAWIK